MISDGERPSNDGKAEVPESDRKRALGTLLGLMDNRAITGDEREAIGAIRARLEQSPDPEPATITVEDNQESRERLEQVQTPEITALAEKLGPALEDLGALLDEQGDVEQLGKGGIKLDDVRYYCQALKSILGLSEKTLSDVNADYLTKDEDGKGRDGNMKSLEKLASSMTEGNVKEVLEKFVNNELVVIMCEGFLFPYKVRNGRAGEQVERAVKIEKTFGIEDITPEMGDKFDSGVHQLLEYGPGRRDTIVEIRSPGYAVNGRTKSKPTVYIGRG